MTKRALPFQGMGAEGWLRLGCAALATCYLLQLAFDIAWHNMCGHLGIDYCALWSAGRVANAYGYARVYDLNMLGQIQASISPPSHTYAFAISPIAYLPVFIIPFQLLSNLSPEPGFWLWVIANLILACIYLLFFAQQTAGARLTPGLLALCVLSLPVYWNFFNGQVNTWLLICIGEALRANLAHRPVRAGAWLAGLMLKPQLLILVVPALLLQRAFKTLGGLALASLALLTASWLMIGAEGMRNLVALWLGFGKGMPTNDVAMMMNWRMLGIAASAVSGPLIGAIITLAGMTATLVAAFYLWWRRIEPKPEASMVAWLGLLAATALFAWHSHVHMAMILIPPILYLHMSKRLSADVLVLWVTLPAALYVAAFVAAALIQAGLLPTAAARLTDLARGAGELGMNIYLVIWAIRTLRSSAAERSTQLPQLARHIA